MDLWGFFNGRGRLDNRTENRRRREREQEEAEIGVVDSEAVGSGLLDMGAVKSRAGGSVSTVMEGGGRTAGTGRMAGLT